MTVASIIIAITVQQQQQTALQLHIIVESIASASECTLWSNTLLLPCLPYPTDRLKCHELTDCTSPFSFPFPFPSLSNLRLLDTLSKYEIQIHAQLKDTTYNARYEMSEKMLSDVVVVVVVS